MITIKLTHMKNDDTDEKKFFTGFEISGHAGFAEKGEDIVCAAVSVLSINTVNAIESLTSNLISVETREDGYLKIQSVDEFDSYGELLMDAFVLGILNIYDEYSNEDYKNEFINIQFEEV